MRFDIWSWQEMEGSALVERGRVLCQASAPGAFYVSAEGHEVCAGYGASLDLRIQANVTVRYEGPKGARCFIHSPLAVYHEASGEVYTNIDRRPDESGALMEVKREVRRFQIEQLQARREARRREADAAREREERRQEAGKPPEPAPDPEPDPEPKPKAGEREGDAAE